MRVFLSWSGGRSRAIAEAFGHWLANAISPWTRGCRPTSAKARDGAKLERAFQECRIGVFVLTKKSLSSPWLNYEAGALSRDEKNLICCLLVDVTRDALLLSPLEQFQLTECTKQEFRKLLTSVNGELGKNGERMLEERRLDTAFNDQWDKLEQRLEDIKKATYDDEVADAGDMNVFEDMVFSAFSEWRQKAFTLEELTVAIAKGMQKGGDPLDVDGLAVMASALRANVLPKMIAGGYVSRDYDTFTLTDSARASLEDMARARSELRARLSEALQRGT